jgi:hypothetical protein
MLNRHASHAPGVPFEEQGAKTCHLKTRRALMSALPGAGAKPCPLR